MTFAVPELRRSVGSPRSGHAGCENFDMTTERVPTCRRPGCGATAGAPDGLCEHHGRAQVVRRALVSTARARPTTGRDLFAALAGVIEARERSWRAEAACRGAGPARFFPVTEVAGHVDYAEALTFCACCPVIDACRSAGAGEPAGVWGGTPTARREARAS